MTENGTLSRIEFTTDTAANWLGIPSQEVRITAKKLGLTAPYAEADLQQIKAELNPAAPQSHGERALVERLKADYAAIENEAIGEFLGNE